MIGIATNYSDIEARHSSGVYGLRGMTLVRGEGAILWDDRGRRYVDCTAAYGVASLGHCHPALVAAVRDQAQQLISCPGIFANDQRALLLQELTKALPAGLDRVFFCNSGTEAIEAGLKFARLATGRPGIIAAMSGFHGRTMGALSATWEPHYREPFAPLLPGVRHIPYDNLAALEAALTDDVGAVLLEIVQGEGGVRPGSAGFLLGAQRLCRERGALLIIDEVQTGFGRTGKLFAVEHYGIEPDLLCLAKGMAGGIPIGAVALGPRAGHPGVGTHGSTFGGNPLACAAARATLRVLHEEQLPQKAAQKGAFLLERLRSIKSRRVREIRGLGLMVGIELRERATPYLQALQERGLLALSAGPTVIRLLPPLIIGDDELEFAVRVLEEVLSQP
ncbi:MAG: acetylornithine aminotransferase [Herpetosiphonaceae bacterium]|nr:MAG: acetylornithine aminotransferase [Herpetosiphonaceae bacterium]